MATNADDLTRRIMEAEQGTQETRRPADDLVRQIQEGGSVAPTDDDQVLAEMVGQTELGEPGMRNLKARFDIARADTRSEKAAAFKQSFPDGELFFQPATGTMVFREDPSDSFKKVDADFLQGGGREVIADVIEFVAADLPAIVGEVGAAVTTRGVSLIPALLRMGGGAAVGELAGELEEQHISGFGDESVFSADMAERMAGQASLAMFGGFVMDKVGRPVVNMARGAGILGVRSGAARAQQAAERLGVGEFPVNLISDNPMVKKLGGQSGALVPTLSRYVERMEIANAAALRTMGAEARQGRIPEMSVLEKTVRDESSQFLSRIRKHLNSTSKPLSEAGHAVKSSIAKFDEVSRGNVNLAYTRARGIEAPNFNITPLRDAAAEIEQRAATMGAEGAELARLARQVKELDPNLPPQRIKDAEGRDTDKLIEATDQLRFLRSQAFDLKTPPPGDIRRGPQQMAARLYGALTRTLRNPANSSPKFLDAWRKADRLAATRFSTREQAVLMQAAKSENPADLAARLGDLSDPRNVDNLKALRSVMPEAKFKQLQDATLERTISKPFELSKVLQRAEPEVLRRMFSTKQIAEMRKAAGDFDKLASTKIQKALEDQSRIGAAVMEMAGQSDTAGISQLRRLVNRRGGPAGPLGRTVRSGIIDDVIERATRFDKGASRVDFNALRGQLDSLRKTGAIRLLQSSDVQFLNDVRRVQDVLRLTPDAGTSIQAAEAAAGARTLSASALITILENVGTGRFFTSKIGRRLLTGTGKNKLPPSDTLKALGGVAGMTVADAEKTGEAMSDIVASFVPSSFTGRQGEQ